MFQLPAVTPFSVSSEYTTLGQRWERLVKTLECLKGKLAKWRCFTFFSASHSQDSASAVDAYSLQSTHSSRHLGQPRGNTVGLTCFCCGLSGHKAKDPSCPANGKSCNKCGKPGHFGRVCKSSTKANALQSRCSNVHFMAPRADNESSDGEYLFTLGNSSRKVPVIINGQKSR